MNSRLTSVAVLTAALAFAGAAVCFAAGAMDYRDDLTAEDRLRVADVTRPASDFSKAEPSEGLPGGAATSQKRINRDAFSNASANLGFEEEQRFKIGNGFFRKLWIASPSSTLASDGLGPLYNAPSCQRCHLKDGRGHPPEGDSATTMLLRLSVPAQTAEQAASLADHRTLAIPDPVYGGQLQDFGTTRVPAEGRVTVSYQEEAFLFPDGERASLRKPVFGIADPAYGPLRGDLMISPRVAPQMIGLGLLEAIHPGDITAQADPEDRNDDGISGRVSHVPDEATGTTGIGRFGWKAEQPTIRQQSAHAFAGDLGISTDLMPDVWGDCTEAQTACRTAPHGEQESQGPGEAPTMVLDLVTFYSANLAVPKRRRPNGPDRLAGKQLFYASGCASCHTPKYVTSRNAERAAHRFQLIWPYTDMLLHDMGEGLSDHRPMANATATEWRTAPLWGIGLTPTVNGHSYYLHDGRARNLTEAILWHGGEALAARDAFAALTREERAQLLTFLESL